jgi:hypothetical protein
LVCEHQKLSDAHSKLQLELSQKGKFNRHIHICQMPCLLFSPHMLPAYLNADTYPFTDIPQLVPKPKSPSLSRG